MSIRDPGRGKNLGLHGDSGPDCWPNRVAWMVTSFSSRWLLCWESWKPPEVIKLRSDRQSRGFLTQSKRPKEVTQRRMFFKRRAPGVAAPRVQRGSVWAAGQGGSLPASSFPGGLAAPATRPPARRWAGPPGRLAQWREAARNSHLFPALAPGGSLRTCSLLWLSSSTGTVGVARALRTHLPGTRSGGCIRLARPGSTLLTSRPGGS